MSTRRLLGRHQENTAERPLQGHWSASSEPVRDVALFVAIVTIVTTLARTALPWRGALGSPLGETDNHLWMLWRAARLLAGQAGPWSNLPVGDPIPLMDPANLPPFLAGAWLDPVLGWNLLALWCVGLALAGGYLLGRELAGPRGAVVAMVATGAAPFLGGVLDFGITEAWGLGWLALHAALLLRFSREGRARDALGAGLCLGALALTGWYQALFGLVAELGLVAWALARGGPRRLPGLLLQGLLALLLVLPSFLKLRTQQGLWAGRWHPPAGGPPSWRPDWHALPIGGTDLLNLVLPSLHTQAPSKAVYLGLVVVLLVLVGLLRRPRVAGPCLALALPFLLLALGPWPTVAGHALGLPGPARGLVQALPSLGALSHWYRAVGAAVPFVAAAAGVGAESLLRGRGRAALLALAGLVLVDGLALSQTPWPRPVVEAALPASLTRAAELAAAADPAAARGVIELPFDNGRAPFSTEPARTYDRWQVRHGLPRSESYEACDALLVNSPLVAGWQAATGLPDRLPPEQRPPFGMRALPPLVDPAAVTAECARLQRWGYRFVVLHSDRAPQPERAAAAVTAALGPGSPVGDDMLWELDPDRR